MHLFTHFKFILKGEWGNEIKKIKTPSLPRSMGECHAWTYSSNKQ